MRIFGLAGWSGSGKTTLMTALIPELVSRGITVSTIKHAHHSFDIDQPGKDSLTLHRRAGAQEVMVASRQRWALMHELRGAAEPSLDDLLERMAPVDLVIVEGFKNTMITEDQVLSSALGKPLYLDDPFVVAVASDQRVARILQSPLAPLEVRQAIANFILGHEIKDQLQWRGDECSQLGGALLSIDAATSNRIEEQNWARRCEWKRRRRDKAASISPAMSLPIDLPPHAAAPWTAIVPHACRPAGNRACRRARHSHSAAPPSAVGRAVSPSTMPNAHQPS